MNVRITVDTKAWRNTLHDLHQRQVPFALSKSINETLLGVQVEERKQLHKVFTLRRPEWAERNVKMVKFAKKGDPVATIGMRAPGNEQRTDILDKFEDKTSKHPRGNTIAIPVSARIKRGNAGIIAKAQRPSAYNFRQVGKAVRGDRGTFIIKKADGSGVILQRDKGFAGRTVRTYIGGRVATITRGVGARSAGVHALYLLVRMARLTPNLRFTPIATQHIDRTWDKQMDKALDHAIATAR